MTSFTRSRSFRRGLTVIYWIALPLVLLSIVGTLLPGVRTAGAVPTWLYAIVLAAFAALIVWRLWLNSRALGYAVPSARRAMLVIIPLCILAVAGLIIALLGVTWIGIGLWLTFEPEAGSVGPWPLGTAIIGCAAVALGLGLTFPFIRVVRRKPAHLPEVEVAVEAED